MTENEIARTSRTVSSTFSRKDGFLIRLGILDGLVRKADRKMDDRNIFLSPIFLSS